jgi:alpha-L-fucosidase
MRAKGEWAKSNEKISDGEYQKYFDFFNPDRFNPKQWAHLARKARMKYVVLTTKHHDGFCLWNTKYTDFNSFLAPRCRRDLVKEVVDAFRAEGIRIGLYYSLADWHHPNYAIDARHPLRGDDIAKLKMSPIERTPEIYTQFLHNQVKELLSDYGKIDLIWFDGSYPETEKYWDSCKLATMIRELQPEILINRLPGFSDFKSPEQSLPAEKMKEAWEGCQILTQHSWGYHVDYPLAKSLGETLEMLVQHVSNSGNLLLNMGPTARGNFPDSFVEMLIKIGDWMEVNEKSIRDCTAAPSEYSPPHNGYYTWNESEKILYLHLFSWPDRRVHLPNLQGRIAYAQLLHDGSELSLTENDSKNPNLCNIMTDACTLALPVKKPATELPVIEIFLK